MIVFPPCKINIGLYITAKRPDGYHAISSLFYPIQLCDALEVVPSDGPKGSYAFTSSGLPIPGDSSSNLVIKAYELLHQHYSLPAVSIHLHKKIPMGAGLGGGSSDGAWMLRLLNDLFELNCSKETLCAFAAQLGSDCPFFIYDGPCAVSGRGEVLEDSPLDLSNYHFWIVNPGIHVSTRDAFASVPIQSAPEYWMNDVQHPPQHWKMINAFEAGVSIKFPEIACVKQQLINEGALYAAMTGSGSSVFGIFEKTPAIEGKFPGYLSVLV
ncbi:MAG: hypothetical protein RLZZ543_1718 [Bacteroidota bacterium]|jgi:4-diphosphocytidyl-2-C-methyl-D-erythritol kinase